MKNKDELKILLLQIREDKETMLEEYYEFLQFSELHKEQLDTLNTYTTIDFDESVLDGYDALYIGGSSDASVLYEDDFKFVENCKKLVRHCYEENIPTLASCFGFQVAVKELGGEIIDDKENMEMGLYEIFLHDNAKEDLLFHDYSSPFWAVSGHKERAITLPENAIHLGYSTLCPYHIFTFENKPFYAFQFHPEVDRKDLVSRITRYQERYLDNDDSLQKIIDTAIHETPESNLIVKNFVDRILLKG